MKWINVCNSSQCYHLICNCLFKTFRCVKKEQCEPFNDLDIREVEDAERHDLAEASFCPDPSNDLKSDPREGTNKEGLSIRSSVGKSEDLPETGYKCCHKDKILFKGISLRIFSICICSV